METFTCQNRKVRKTIILKKIIFQALVFLLFVYLCIICLTCNNYATLLLHTNQTLSVQYVQYTHIVQTGCVSSSVASSDVCNQEQKVICVSR